MKPEKAIKEVLKYYSFFRYSPTPEEIYTFLPVKISKRPLFDSLKTTSAYIKNPYITPARKKKHISEEKLGNAIPVINVLSHVSYIKFLGLSGSMAMMNANDQDDIDIFIITAKNRMWTTRFIVLTILTLLSKRRKRTDVNVRNKLCANLWFDESDLSLPKSKRNLFTAHEVMQLRPMINKDSTYERFLEANQWVIEYFPNAQYKKSPLRPSDFEGQANIKYQNYPKNLITYLLFPFSNILEYLFKQLQLIIINRHRTSEIINDTQLWFFPDDFEKKLRKEGIL